MIPRKVLFRVLVGVIAGVCCVALAVGIGRAIFRRPIQTPASGTAITAVVDTEPRKAEIELRKTGAEPDSAVEWKSPAGYVGSQACRQCHAAEFESHRETSHCNSLSEVDPAAEPVDAVFDHVASGRRYRVARRDGVLIHEESIVGDDGREFVLTSAPVRYRVGSGHFARTYLCEIGEGFLFESPLTWYASTQAWGMTPGFDRPGHRSFSRPVLQNCLMCHCGGVSMSSASNFRLRPVEYAIGCERCHGPGEKHVDYQLAAASDRPATDPIVNPKRLSRKLAEAICQQCHLQGEIRVGGRGVRDADFRPGLPLEQFGTVYRLRRRDSEMTVVGHVEQLAGSACYRGSESLTCVTCHHPHQQDRSMSNSDRYRAVCSSCHIDHGCKLEISIREAKARNDCVQCHMPKSATEVPHLAFTHHRIGIHPLKSRDADADAGNLLVPLSDLSDLSESDRRRSLMLARLQVYLKGGNAGQRTDSGQRFAGEFESWQRGLSDDADVEVEFARTQFLFAQGDIAGAERSAKRTLGAGGIRTEEEAALLDQLGQLDFNRQRYDDAANRFERLVRLRPHGSDFFRLGVNEERRGRLEAAGIALERARRLEPATIGIYEALSRVRRSQGDTAAEERLRDDILMLQRRFRSDR